MTDPYEIAEEWRDKYRGYPPHLVAQVEVDQLVVVAKELAQLRERLANMECGHALALATVNSDGLNYCRACELDRLRAIVEKVREYAKAEPGEAIFAWGILALTATAEAAKEKE